MKILLVIAALSMPALLADKCGDLNIGGGSSTPTIVQQ